MDGAGSLYVIPRSAVEKIYTMKQAIKSQEQAFMALGQGRAEVLPIVHHDVSRFSGHLEIKPGVATRPAVFGLKLISLYPDNARSGISPMQATVLVNDAKTGLPLAIADGVHITNLRTAAAGAVGAKYLARKRSRRVGVIGTGVQGRLQVAALKEVLGIGDVKAWSPSSRRRRRFALDMEERLGVPATAVSSAEEAARDVDVLITATPSTVPIVKREWLSEGLHIDSIGADRRGKRELSPAVYANAKVFTDCRGVALAKGLFTSRQISAELGEVVAGIKKGREDDSEITIFDSSGVGVQDIVALEMIYRKAKANRLGYKVRLF